MFIFQVLLFALKDYNVVHHLFVRSATYSPTGNWVTIESFDINMHMGHIPGLCNKGKLIIKKVSTLP